MSKSPPDAKADVFWQGAVLVASKLFTKAEASRRLGQDEETLGRFSRDHPGRWNALLRRAGGLLRLIASATDVADEVPQRHREILVEAASLKKDDVSWQETAERLNLPLSSLERIITRYEGFWKALCGSLAMVDPRRARRGISDRTRDDIWRGFKMVGEENASRREASRRLGRGPMFLANCMQNHQPECKRACLAYGVPLRGKLEFCSPAVRSRMDRAAMIVASGVSKMQTAKRLRVPPANLISNLKKNQEYFDENKRRAMDLLGIPAGCTQRAVLVNGTGDVVLIDDDGKVVKRGTHSHDRGPGPAVWDKRTGELRYLGKLAREVGRQARHVRLILDAFQELNWPMSMDDPLPRGGGDPVARLQDAVKSLNDGLKVLRFRTERGTRILWGIAGK